MNLSDKEQTFLVRGLDKATTPDEADTCAIEELESGSSWSALASSFILHV